MQERAPLADLRRRYAGEIIAAAHPRSARVEEAFATVPREEFLTPPPWRVFAPGGLVEKITSDPADLYDDVLVVLDGAQGINNGQPSLHAAWISAIDPRPGETAIHIGIGTGYYTAILATLVGGEGRVHAYEIDQPLAALARERLARFPNTTVHATSGVAAALPKADVIDVNAGATAPDPGWLRALKPKGRLVFPWQLDRGSAVTMLVERRPKGFRAKPTFGVGFIPCIGAQGERSDRRAGGDPSETRSVWLSAARKPDDTAIAVYEEVWFSSDPV